MAGNGIDKPSASQPVTPLAISGQGPPAPFYSDLISVLDRVASGIEHLVSNGIKGAFYYSFNLSRTLDLYLIFLLRGGGVLFEVFPTGTPM